MWVVYVPRTDPTLQKLAQAWAPIRQTKGDAKKAKLEDAIAKAAEDKKYRVVVVKYPDAIPNPSSLDKDDVVYVMGGHCRGSSENVTWPDNHKNPIRYDEVADRLVDAGLRSDFKGEIKVYSCQSGIGGDEAFGKRFAAYLRNSKNFTCRIWAYTGNISTDYINAESGVKSKGLVEELRQQGGIHKFMQLQTGSLYVKRTMNSKDEM